MAIDFSKFLIHKETEYRITWDKRVLVQNFYYFNIDLVDVEFLKFFIFDFLTTVENKDLKLRTQFPRAIYVKVHVRMTVNCPLLGLQSRDYYFSTTSYLVNSEADFKEKMKMIALDLQEQVEKLKDEIQLESQCIIEDIVLVHINIAEWVDRYMVAKRFKLDPKELEIFETPKVIGFRNAKTKRFVYVIRKEKVRVKFVRIGKIERIKRKKKVSRKKTTRKKKVSKKKSGSKKVVRKKKSKR